MGDRQVAAITPTPQLETGRLSPANTGTPRIPLAELDATALSQRLFHSPAVQREAKSSPSNLLYTQLPQSSERPFGFRAEQELAELRRQMEMLNRLVMQNSNNNRSYENTDELQRLLEEITEEKDSVCVLLKEKEEELTDVKQRLSQLQAEYLRDVRQVKSQALSLTQEVSSRETAYSTLEQEHRKSLKCIHSLRSYIEGLPTVDEVRELKAALEAKQAECTDTASLARDLEQSMKGLRARLKTEQDENLRLQVELKELRGKNATLVGQVREAERLRLTARNLDESDIENVLFDLAEQKLEAERLRSLSSWKETQWEQAKQQLETQVRHLSGLLEEANVQLRDRSAAWRQSEAGRRALESQLAGGREQVAHLTKRLEEMSQEVMDLQAKDRIGQEIGQLFSRISSCLEACLKELSLLRDLTEELVKGRDPNLSVLLGVRETSLLQSPPAAYSSLSSQQRLNLARGQLESARAVLMAVRSLRESLGEQYADRLADNMTSCVTQ